MSRNTFVSKAKRFFHETILLLRAIPSPVVALFVMSVIAMNLLANKTIFQRPYLAIDGGILVSWLSLFAIAVNLLTCLIFYIVSIIPVEGEDYTAFNTIIGGTWFILLSSTIAFLCSAIINNFLNYIIGKAFKNNPSGKLAYIARSYISTFIGQFFDNFIFAVLTFMVFAPIFWDGFSWSFVQCVTCSVLGAFLELLFEVIFSPIGYAITKNWEKQNVGKEYFDYIEANK